MNKMLSRTAIRVALALGLLAIFAFYIAGVLPMRAVDQLERGSYDTRMALTLPGGIDPNVIIIDMDEKSFASQGGWPWPRSRFAVLINQLFDKYKIKAIGFDITFPERDRRTGIETLNDMAAGPMADIPGFADRLAQITPSLDFDTQFGAALRGRAVVTGYVFKDSVSSETKSDSLGLLPKPLVEADAAKVMNVPFYKYTSYTSNLDVIQQGAASGGYFDNSQGVDEDGVFRRIPVVQQYQGALYSSLSLELARVATGSPGASFVFDPPNKPLGANFEAVKIGNYSIPVDEHGRAFVPFRGPYPSFAYISAGDVILGTADAAKLAGKIALLGTTAPGLLDLRATPVGKAYPGVEVHANLISGILEHRIKHQAAYYNGIHFVMLLVIALALGFGASGLTPLANGGLALGLVTAVIGLGFALWSWGDFIIPMGSPVLFTFVLFLLLTFYGYFLENRKEREISKRFGEYIPPELVAEMAANPLAASMEGEKRNMSVLFSDVRGFTTISEKLDSKELTALMNQLLTPLTKVIHQHRGTIDKYMGDAIMAFWGAPLPDPAHATHALEAGLKMLTALRELDAGFEAKGWPKLYIGVGINTGEMTVGNMGSEFRRAYTVMGDAVNLGSRLEGLTKEYGVYFICSESTKNAGPADWAYRELDRVKVKGKNDAVAIYEPLGHKDSVAADLKSDLIRHRNALKLYRAQSWDQAEVEFYNLSRGTRPHKLYTVFLERINFLRRNPPAAGWDGSFTFTTK